MSSGTIATPEDPALHEIISPATAKRLAAYGITFINSANEIILKRDATVVAKLSKTSARLLGPAIAMLDAQAAEGLLRLQTRSNIDRYYQKTNDLAGRLKMQQMLSRDDHPGVVIFLLARGHRYKNIGELLSEGGQ